MQLRLGAIVQIKKAFLGIIGGLELLQVLINLRLDMKFLKLRF